MTLLSSPMLTILLSLVLTSFLTLWPSAVCFSIVCTSFPVVRFHTWSWEVLPISLAVTRIGMRTFSLFYFSSLTSFFSSFFAGLIGTDDDGGGRILGWLIFPEGFWLDLPSSWCSVGELSFPESSRSPSFEEMIDYSSSSSSSVVSLGATVLEGAVKGRNSPRYSSLLEISDSMLRVIIQSKVSRSHTLTVWSSDPLISFEISGR